MIRTMSVVAGVALSLWLIAVTLPGLVHPPAIAAFRATGLPDVLRWVLCLAEIAGAVLLLTPRAWKAGAAVLALVLAAAVALHAAIGANPVPLIVYMAVLGLTSAGRARKEAAHGA